MSDTKMQSGARPRIAKRSKLSFHRSFGSSIDQAPAEFNFDAGLGFPDQNAVGTPDSFPLGCTAITQKELCQDEDGVLYLSKYTYDKTLQIEGINPGDPRFENVGCDIGDSLNSTIAYGVDRGDGSNPLLNRRGAVYDVLDGSGMDAFDSFISTMWTNYQKTGKKTSISFGCPWYAIFEDTGLDGIVPSPLSYSVPTGTPWHDSKICGVKIIDGVEYLINKSWQGTEFGAGGMCYFSREQINAIMAVAGTCADVLAPYVPGQSQTVILTLEQIALSYLQLWYHLITMPMTTSDMQMQPPKPAPTLPSHLDIFCTAIRDFEGAPGDLNYQNNNPGNCRCSPEGYLPKYGTVTCIDDFAHFETYTDGWNYLQALVTEKVTNNPTWTFLDFFNNYAPPSDNNPSVAYAENVAGKCGVPADSLISQYLT